MTHWLPALLDAVPATSLLRKPTSVLAAIALDNAGVTVEHAMSGCTIIVAKSATLRASIEGLVMTVFETSKFPYWQDESSTDAVLIVANPKQQAGWRTTASDTGRAALVIVGGIEDVHPKQAIDTADHIFKLDGQFLPGSLEAAILAMTGEYVELEDHWPRVSFEDAIACIQRGSSAVECATRLHRLITGQQRAQDEADADAEDMARRLDEPAPLGQVASGVVKNLSEMTGFGDAGRWGVATAADIRAYAEGQLAWSEVDRGVLVSGPPGSGKTTFAKAFALECGPGVDFVTTTYTEWSAAGSGFGDSMSKGMTKLFEKWREMAKKRPLVLFIDEIDTMGKRGGNDHNESWFTSVINAWLAFLDGAVSRNGIVVVAATNFPDRVDPALLRPGRLDRIVELPYPGIDAMIGIVRHHLGPDATIDDAELARAARACRGMSPATVEQVCREARRMARTMCKRRVCADDVTLVLGAQRLAALQHPGAAEFDRRVALHEAGHAVALLSAPGERLSHVDLDAAMTWGAGQPALTLAATEARLTILLAGLAAEQVLCGGHSSGVSGDLRDATSLATTAQAAWGMGERGLRQMSIDDAMSDATVKTAVDEILGAAHARALALVEGSREAVTRLADRLQSDRYLDAAEVRVVVSGRPAPETTASGDRVAHTIRRGRRPHPTP